MDLKKEIAKIQGEAFMKLNEIRLMKNSQEPRDITTLRDARIVDNDTLSIKKKCFPPMNILVAGYNAKTHNILITRDNPEVLLNFLDLLITTIQHVCIPIIGDHNC